MGTDWHLVSALSLHVQYALRDDSILIQLVIATGLAGCISFIDWEGEVEKVTKRIEEEQR